MDDRDGARYVGNGWATSPDYTLPGAAPSETVTVQPDSVTHKASTGGA